MSKKSKRVLKQTTSLSSLSELKLIPQTKLRGMEDIAINGLNKNTDLVIEITHQWVMHAEKHGDHTGLQAWIQRLYKETKGLIIAGLVKWIHDNSPIRLTAENGVVSAVTLKKDEAGYKPFTTEKMGEESPLTTAEVTGRAQRPIEPYSVKLVNSRVKSLMNQFRKAQEEGGRGIVGSPEVLQQYLEDLAAVKVRPVKVGNKTIAYDPKKEQAELDKLTRESEEAPKMRAAG